MLRLMYNLYSKEWKIRFEELMERELTLTEFYNDICECKALRINYCGVNPSILLETTEYSIECVKKKINEMTNMTLIEKMRYKG